MSKRNYLKNLIVCLSILIGFCLCNFSPGLVHVAGIPRPDIAHCGGSPLECGGTTPLWSAVARHRFGVRWHDAALECGGTTPLWSAVARHRFGVRWHDTALECGGTTPLWSAAARRRFGVRWHDTAPTWSASAQHYCFYRENTIYGIAFTEPSTVSTGHGIPVLLLP